MANDLLIRGFIDDIILPDVGFPQEFLPASSIRLSSLEDHCLLPWISTVDTYSQFYLGGGTSGRLEGALGGLELINQFSSITNKAGSFGFTTLGPESGFCISNIMKHHLYARIDLQNFDGAPIITKASPELVQNSVYRRIYLINGVINSVNESAETNSTSIVLGVNRAGINYIGNLNIEIDVKIYPEEQEDPDNPTYEIIKKRFEIKNIQNSAITIAGTGHHVTGSSYYEIDTPICLEDPYLLSGHWQGNESEAGEEKSSKHNLFVTSHNKPYAEGEFLGVYVLATNDADPPPKPDDFDVGGTFDGIDEEDREAFFGYYDGWYIGREPSLSSGIVKQTTSAPDDSLGVFDGTPNYTPHELFSVSITHTVDLTLNFISFGGESEVYPDDTRYYLQDGFKGKTSDGYTDTFDKIEAGDIQLYDILMENKVSTFYTEISTGGNESRNNFHAGCLTGNLIFTGGKYFEIIGHPQANIIYVSGYSVDGKTFFDPNKFKTYSIVNQYGWLLNELFINFTAKI